jgi:antitoxin component of RelBE/YafQ-DinJ toxin-antitoxin module
VKDNDWRNTELINTRVPPDLKRDVEEAAAEMDVTVSRLVRIVLRQFVAWQKESKSSAE